MVSVFMKVDPRLHAPFATTLDSILDPTLGFPPELLIRPSLDLVFGSTLKLILDPSPVPMPGSTFLY